jgi:uncharacterized damage-inducible protein DinB
MVVSDPPTKVESARLADQLERSFRGGAWHGPSLAEGLEGLDASAVRRHPLPGAHSIAEIVGHLVFWLETASRRLEGEDPARGLPAEADWPPLADGDDAWPRLLDELEAAHRQLHAKVLALSDGDLDGPVAGCDPTVRGLLHGILQHNAYHGGQIVLLAKEGAAQP